MFNPLDPDFIRDPYPTYEQLRTTTPLLYLPEQKMWFVSLYEDVNALLRDRRFGRTMDHILTREERGLPPKRADLAPFDKLSENSMFDKEPPDHTRLRTLVHKVFTPRRVEMLRGKIAIIANDLLDQVADKPVFDLLEDYATPLPVSVIAELLGVPEEDQHYLRPWSQAIVAMYELDHSAEQERLAVQASIDFDRYLRGLFKERRKNPKDDLITALVQVEEAGDRLTEDEMVSTCILLLNAGHEATVNVIGNGWRALFHNPDQLNLLYAQPELIPLAVEEMMRFDVPLQLFRRWVLEDVEYAGHSFKQGEQLALLFGSANRDEKQFPNAHRMDITRKENPHISFSAGIHYCLGAPLARLELQVSMQTLLKRFRRLELVEEPTFRPTHVIRGLYDLKVAPLV